MTQPQPREPGWNASLTARYSSPARTLALAFIAAIGAAAAAVLLVAMLVVVQGRSADTRHADAILVIGGTCEGSATNTCPQAAVLDHALDLFRRGYATHVLVAADDADTSRAHLLGAGLPADALLEAPAGSTPWQRARAAADTLRTQGMNSALLASQPSDMLVALKMTRDLGLIVYAAPLASETRIPSVPVLLGQAGAYWRYVLLGE